MKKDLLPTHKAVLFFLGALLALCGGGSIIIPLLCRELSASQAAAVATAGEWGRLILGLFIGVGAGAVAQTK
jgi:hypothetical protein